MAEQTEYESAFNHGAGIGVVIEQIHGVDHVLIPPGFTLQSMEKLLPAPKRIVANPEFADVAGFADYANEFKQDGSRVFVDASKFRFFTIFDFHAKDQPAWGDHSASLTMNRSPEWQRLLKVDSLKMAPMELAEWLEENMQYVAGPIQGGELLTMAQNLKVALKGNLDIESSTQKGLRHLEIRDDSTLRGSNAKGKALEFPEQLDMNLRIFENHTAYSIKVFLRYRATKDAVTFWFKVPDPQRIENEAFEVVIEDVRNATKLKTLKGSFQGPRHK